MESRSLGNSGLRVTPIGFGAFKIGRNEGIKYPIGYALPDEPTVERLLNTVLDLGIDYIDTAPAYGLSEERIGKFLSHRRTEFVLSTKVGETFAEGRSDYDFSAEGVRNSVERSLRRLKTDCLDIVFVHSDGNDDWILRETDCLSTLADLKSRGLIRNVGFSGKTVEGASSAIACVDVLMVEYHLEDQSHAEVIAEAKQHGIGIVVKKGLASGHLPPEDALRFLCTKLDVTSVVIGGLNPNNLASNILISEELRGNLT